MFCAGVNLTSEQFQIWLEHLDHVVPQTLVDMHARGVSRTTRSHVDEVSDLIFSCFFIARSCSTIGICAKTSLQRKSAIGTRSRWSLVQLSILHAAITID